MKPTISILLLTCVAAPLFSQVESDELLRNPAYLIKKYNQLALQYNALVEKARKNLDSKSIDEATVREIHVANPLNESLERANADLTYKLRNAQVKLNQGSQRGQTLDARNRFLEEENAQLKEKLHEFRISEASFEERSRRLAVEIRRAKTEAQNFEVLEKQLRREIRQFQGSDGNAKRQLVTLKEDSRTLSIENRKLTAAVEQLTVRLEDAENDLALLRDAED